MIKNILYLVSLIFFILPFSVKAQTGIECKGCDKSKPVIPIDSVSPRITINGSSGGFVDSISVASWDILKVFIRTATGIDTTSWQVTGYSCLVHDSLGAKVSIDTRAFAYSNSTLNDDIKAAIKLIKKDGLIIFHDIHLMDEAGVRKTISLGPVFRKQN